MSATAGPPRTRPDPLKPLRARSWVTEAQRKAIHVGSIILPLGLLYEWLPWPRDHAGWRLLLLSLVLVAVALDVLRIQDDRARRFFRQFFGELIREHERFNLLGSTYLLLAALLAIEIFPRPVAAAAVGFTVLGDAFAAIVGKAWGRTRLGRKSLEGLLGCLAACLAWASFLALGGHLTWPVALLGASVASLVEFLPIPLDDNLGITLAAGYAMRLMVQP